MSLGNIAAAGQQPASANAVLLGKPAVPGKIALEAVESFLSLFETLTPVAPATKTTGKQRAAGAETPKQRKEEEYTLKAPKAPAPDVFPVPLPVVERKIVLPVHLPAPQQAPEPSGAPHPEKIAMAPEAVVPELPAAAPRPGIPSPALGNASIGPAAFHLLLTTAIPPSPQAPTPHTEVQPSAVDIVKPTVAQPALAAPPAALEPHAPAPPPPPLPAATAPAANQPQFHSPGESGSHTGDQPPPKKALTPNREIAPEAPAGVEPAVKPALSPSAIAPAAPRNDAAGTETAARVPGIQKVEAKPELPPPAPAAPAKEISLRLNSEKSAANVDVTLTERAGRVHVEVRTPDRELAQTLRADLGELVGRLEEKGYKTEAWSGGDRRPASPDPANSAAVRAPDNFQGSRQDGQPSNPGNSEPQHGQPQGQPHGQQQRHRGELSFRELAAQEEDNDYESH